MSIESGVPRRAVLVGGAAGAGTALVAACGSSGGGKSSTATGGASTAAASTGQSGQSPAESASGGQPAGGLAKLSAIPVGQAISATIDGKPAIIARPTSGTAVAFTAICTHMGCTVAPAGSELHCPCHGSKYQATTGQVIQGPAPRPLDKITVHVAGGEVVAG
jgi:Rieske Fe-S protein